MRAAVYLETSFVSACVTTRQDAASVYRRDTSQEWWRTQAHRYDLVVSAEVLAELSHPDFPNSASALEMIAELPLAQISDEVLGVAELLVREKVMPGPVAGDAVHVAAATVFGADYILSWNVRHLANPSKVTHLREICRRAGLIPPAIVTPELLWEDADETG